MNSLPVREQKDFPVVFNMINQLADRSGMSVTKRSHLLTAASELLFNLLIYGKGGEVILQVLKKSKGLGIQVIFADKGPGIPDIDLAMTSGYSTGKTLGLGLPGAKKLSDEFFILSTLGEGTVVTILKYV